MTIKSPTVDIMKVTVERMTIERENRARNCANVDVLKESDIGATKTRPWAPK